jgi:hypothetical protein
MGTPSGTDMERLEGARANVSMRATDMGVWDEVSVLQVWPAVKRKARDGYRYWSGGGGLTDEAW